MIPFFLCPEKAIKLDYTCCCSSVSIGQDVPDQRSSTATVLYRRFHRLSTSKKSLNRSHGICLILRRFTAYLWSFLLFPAPSKLSADEIISELFRLHARANNVPSLFFFFVSTLELITLLLHGHHVHHETPPMDTLSSEAGARFFLVPHRHHFIHLVTMPLFKTC